MHLFVGRAHIQPHPGGVLVFSVPGPTDPGVKVVGVFLQPTGGLDFDDVFSTRVKRIGWSTHRGQWEAVCVIRREDISGGAWGMEFAVDALWACE